jgi:hypothetical protein
MAGINYSVSSNWGSGFVANMSVAADNQSLDGWTIEFDASFDITNIWGAEIVSHVGDHYVISNADWNADVAPGSQASFGFQATTARATRRCPVSFSTAQAHRRPRPSPRSRSPMPPSARATAPPHSSSSRSRYRRARPDQ